jgi:DNA-binding response OmpR family regulator
MPCPDLNGRSILIVEDEPLIALDIASAFEKSGAKVTTTGQLKHALTLVEHDGLSAAILDHALRDGDSDALCQRLKERGIPFVNYTGLSDLDGACGHGPSIPKPADPNLLVAKVAELLKAA